MKQQKVFLIILLVTGGSQAQSMTASHQAGKQWTQGLLTGSQQASQSVKSEAIPHASSSVPIGTEDNPLALESKGASALSTSEVGQFLLETHRNRPHFTIDADKDSLVTRANVAVQNPQRVLEVTVKAESADTGGKTSVTMTCEEPGEDYPESCVVRVIPEIRQKYEKVFLYQHHWGWGRHPYNSGYINFFDVNHPYPHHSDYDHYEWREGDNGHFHTHQNHYKYQKRFEAPNQDGSISQSDPTDITPEGYQEYLNETGAETGQAPPPKVIQAEDLHSSCHLLEELMEKGICEYAERVCIEPTETRVIRGVPITRECWAYRQTYRCIQPIQGNTCAALRAKGCHQVSSRCKTQKREVCLVYEQTYACPAGEKNLQQLSTQGGRSLFCLTGNCADTSYEANGELFEAMSHLAVLKEAQDDIRQGIAIFKGNDLRCTRNCINFRDCCGAGRGWGMSSGLARCSANEKDLALKRNQRKCVQIGTYCVKKLLGQCLEKKTTFCCFGTKLARLIQEAGHQQLGLSWGPAQSPNCQGLSPDQLSRMDFSKVDFSELFQDIADKFKPKNPTELTQSVSADRLKENMASLTAKMKRPIRPAQQGKEGKP